MNADAAARWRRVQALCELVEPMAPGERAARLRALEQDDAIRQEVLDLVEALDQEGRLQQTHAPVAAVTKPREALPHAIGGVLIEARLGSGGSGEVYRGVRTSNGTEQMVAVKLFHTHRAAADDLARFAREQQALATLTHPAIIRFFDAGTTPDGRPFLVMELAEGRSLVEYCDDRALPIPARLRMFLRVCEAVDSAHRRGILHLDLKPSNVIVAGDEAAAYIKLVDFGTAKLMDAANKAPRTEPLTVQYASPERLRGDGVSVACDVYSLGLILFELLSGGWPFRRPESVVAVAERAAGVACALSLSQQVTPLAAERRGMTVHALKDSLEGDLQAIVSRATVHEPERRFASVAAMVESVQGYLDGSPIRRRIDTPDGRTSVWARRKNQVVMTMMAVLVTITGALLYSWAGARNVASPPTPPAEAAAPTAVEVVTEVAAPAATEQAGQQPPLPFPPGGEDSRTSMRTAPGDPEWQTFDDFTVAEPTVIKGLSWRGTYCSPMAGSRPQAPTAHAFVVTIYPNNANSPGGGDGPDRSAPIWSETIPVDRAGEATIGWRMGRCANQPSTYAHFRYSTTFKKPFQAAPKTRYWMLIQAQIKQFHGTQKFLYWAWVSGPVVNQRTIQYLPEQGPLVFFRDREMKLIK